MKRKIAGGLLALSPLLNYPTPLLAADDPGRLETLERRIKILERRLELAEEQGAVTEQKVTASLKEAVIAKTNGRSLAFDDDSGGYSFQMGGRLQTDAAFYDADINDFGDGTRVRRLFVDVRGTVYKNWNYRFQYDFARPGGSDSSARGIRDAYIQYTGFGPELTIGQFKEPFGLEHLQSSLHTTFIERGLTNAFNPDRRIGVGISGNGSAWTAAAGLFGETAEGDVAGEGDEGWDLTGRFTWAPLNEAGNVVHLGIAGRHHQPEDSTNSLRFRERPESNVTDIRLVDTGTLSGVDDLQSIGLEAGAVAGPFSLQAEYITTSVNRSGALDDVDLNAWYAYGSYFLTGESRVYKGGIFDRIKPSSTVGQGGIGGWEIGLRYSAADLTDGSVIGGEQENLTLGLNWYATQNVKLQANYITVLDVERAGNPFDGEDHDSLLIRAQIDF